MDSYKNKYLKYKKKYLKLKYQIAGNNYINVDNAESGHIKSSVQNIILKYGDIDEIFGISKGEIIAQQISDLNKSGMLGTQSSVWCPLIWNALKLIDKDLPIQDNWLNYETSIKDGTKEEFIRLYTELSNLNGWFKYALNVLNYNFDKIPSNSNDFYSDFVIKMSELIKNMKNIKEHYLSTNFNSDGKGNSLYLDRHNIKCQDKSYLNSFKMWRDVDNKKYKYNYTCVDSIHKNENYSKKMTELNDDGGGNIVYLDRHVIDCDKKGILGFRLDRGSTKDKIRYNYICGDKDLNNLKEKNTEFNDEVRGNSFYLDRHDVKCDNNEILTKFQLVRDIENNKIRYNYVCGSQ